MDPFRWRLRWRRDAAVLCQQRREAGPLELKKAGVVEEEERMGQGEFDVGIY